MASVMEDEICLTFVELSTPDEYEIAYEFVRLTFNEMPAMGETEVRHVVQSMQAVIPYM